MAHPASIPNVRTAVARSPAIYCAPDRTGRSAKARYKGLLSLALMFALSGMIGLSVTLNPRTASSQAVHLVKVDVALVAQGYRASKLIGSGVTNDKNESIGSIDDLVVDKKNVMFAVLQVGGFLGIGKHLVSVPSESLQVSEDGKKIVLPGASKDALKNLAEFKYRT